jgi:CubicO group peptidase (beta-lactamase class C family)
MVFACAHPGDAQRARTDAQIAAEIGRYMQAAVTFEKFTGAILVARDGRPIVNRAYGLANVELGVPNTPRTVFRLASLTTQFTAAAIMLLQERGQLSVDHPACQYLANCPPAWQPITIRQLLTMTAGIPSAHGVELGPLQGFPVPWSQWVDAIGRKPLLFPPGTDLAYDYSGYNLLGFIIEKLSGQTYGEFISRNIFAPLGMTHTGYEDPLRIVPHRATGYRQLPGDPITNVPYIEVIRLYAAGGVYSTTADLLRWDQALATGKLLSRPSIDAMHAPAMELLPGKAYASGVWITQRHGRTEIANGGNLPGFLSHMARYPSDRVTVIVLSNNGGGSSGKISGVLSAIVFGAPYEMPYERKAVSVDAAVLERYVGEYRLQLPKLTMVMTREGGRLFMRRDAEPKVELFAESDSRFFLKVEDVQLTFETDASGVVTGVVVHQGDSGRYDVLRGRRESPM